MRPIIFPAQIEGIATRSDKTIKVVIGTQEMTPSDAGRLFALNQRLSYIAIKEEAFNDNETKMIESMNVDAEDVKARTPSQRLRAILYVLWKENNSGHEAFDSFYSQHLEKIIQHFKDKVDTLTR